MSADNESTADGLRIQNEELREQLRKAKAAGGRWYWAEKFLLPIMIAVGSGIIAISQLAVGLKQSRTELEIQQARDSTMLQLQYLQLFYDDISRFGDEDVQKASLTLLRFLEPGMGARMALAISENPDYPPAIRARAGALQGTLSLGALAGYEVNIYYLREHEASQAQARRLAADLRARAQLRVDVEPRPRAFFWRSIPPGGQEIRYSGDVEEPAARALLDLLSRSEGTDFRLRRAPARQPDSRLSLFLPY